jgi:hypothetical protein
MTGAWIKPIATPVFAATLLPVFTAVRHREMHGILYGDAGTPGPTRDRGDLDRARRGETGTGR